MQPCIGAAPSAPLSATDPSRPGQLPTVASRLPSGATHRTCCQLSHRVHCTILVHASGFLHPHLTGPTRPRETVPLASSSFIERSACPTAGSSFHLAHNQVTVRPAGASCLSARASWSKNFACSESRAASASNPYLCSSSHSRLSVPATTALTCSAPPATKPRASS